MVALHLMREQRGSSDLETLSSSFALTTMTPEMPTLKLTRVQSVEELESYGP